MPSQTQRQAHHRKADRSNRRFTTLSFEQIDRTKKRIFTEDISAASRIPRPAYCVREDEVLGANMPDTIKLAKHRSKIYVGLSDNGSTVSSHRSNYRGTSRERTSASTSISKASIIDWSDSRSEISTTTAFSGELSSLLPPVHGSKPVLTHPPPGVDTADLFTYRSTVHRKPRGPESRSPLPLPSRGMPRPPTNTPYPAMARPDEFAATFRKRITPRRIPLDNCNVVLLGGSITPLATSRIETKRSKSFLSNRENPLLTHRRIKKGDSIPNLGSNGYIGIPRFDLPMIDLKCVESPIANLGDLEEKGIRLVKLRKVKKRKSTKELGSLNSDRSGRDGSDLGSEAGTLVDEKETQRVKEQDELIDSFRSLGSEYPADETRQETVENDDENKKSPNEKNNTNKNTNGIHLSLNRMESSLTTPSPGRKDGNSTVEDKEERPDGVVLTNREPYSTPLLPDIDTTPRVVLNASIQQNKKDVLHTDAPALNTAAGTDNLDVTCNDKIDREPVKDELKVVVKPIQNSEILDSINNNIVVPEIPETKNSQILEPVSTLRVENYSLEGDSGHLMITVEKMDSTPIPLTPLPIAEDEEDSVEEPPLISEEEGRSFPHRFQKRSSSLLTVPGSITMSERRPPAELDPGGLIYEHIDTPMYVEVDDVDKEIQEIIDNNNDDKDDDDKCDVKITNENMNRRQSVTIATQTTPPPGN